MKIAVIYASDYGDISPGGIQNYVKLVAPFHPAYAAVTYFGVGTTWASVLDGSWASVMHDLPSGPLNLSFTMKLRKLGAQLRQFDVVVAHRPEYLSAIDHPHRVLILHGGTWNAWRTGRRVKGATAAAAEFVASIRAQRVLSVDPMGASRLIARAAGSIGPLRVPVHSAFAPTMCPPPNSRFVTTSRLVSEKRVDLILELAARVGRPVDVFGDGPERARLETTAYKLGAQATFHGAQTPSTVADNYRKGGTFVTCGIAEGYPLAAAEALSIGLPAIGLTGAGLPQLERYGLKLYPKLSEMCIDNTHYRAPSQQGHDVYRAHSAKTVGEDFWAKVVGVSGSAVN